MDDESDIVDDKIVYKLMKPFKFGSDETVREIVLEEPTASEMQGITLDIPTDGKMSVNISTALMVVKKCCQEPPSKINKIKTADLIQAYAKCLELFFSDTV